VKGHQDKNAASDKLAMEHNQTNISSSNPEKNKIVSTDVFRLCEWHTAQFACCHTV